MRTKFWLHSTLTALAVAFLASLHHAEADAVVPHASRLQLTPCTVPDIENTPREMLCGTYHVYENRITRRGRTLPLKVIMVPARSGTPQGVIYVFAGGPSDAATEYAPWIPYSWESANHDVVLVDMRGTGAGHSLDCPFWRPGDPLQNYFQTGVDRLLACQRHLRNVDLSQYSTPNFLQDVNDVRAALGHERIILRGGSYGSRAALAFIKMFEPHVGMAVLSGLAPFENRLDLNTPRDTQAALSALFADCAADAACSAAYPNPAEDLSEVRMRLQQRPATVRVTHPTTGATEEIVLSDRWFTRLLAARLHELSEARKIPWLLQRARAGDFADLTAGRLAEGGEGRARVLRASVLCTEDVGRIQLAELERETAGMLSDLGMPDSMYLCARWPQTALPPDYFQPFRSNVPTLLLSGDRDPLTAARWGEVAQRSLPNSVHVILPVAHSYRPDHCIGSIGTQFLQTGSVDGLDTSCVSSMPRPPFYVPAAGEAEPQRH